MMDQNDLVYRLRKRAEIRRQIPTRAGAEKRERQVQYFKHTK
jgi:hypothetical protein